MFIYSAVWVAPQMFFLLLVVFLGMAQGKRYIVLFKDEMTSAQAFEHRAWMEAQGIKGSNMKGFTAPGVEGYVGTFTEQEAKEIAKRDEVAKIEEDQQYHIQTSISDTAPHLMEEMEVGMAFLNPSGSLHSFLTPQVHAAHNILRGRRAFRRKSMGARRRRWFQRAQQDIASVLPLDAEAMQNQPVQSNVMVLSQKEKTKNKLKPGRQSPLSLLHYPDDISRVVVQEGAPWGASRVSQRKVYSLESYVYPESAGAGVTVYVLDTGVESEHEELRGRVDKGINIVEENTHAEDDNGHGTHCAGVIAGKTFGVAKKAKIVPVKILAASGVGTTERTILGLIYAIKHHHSRVRDEDSPKSVINMSLGGLRSGIINEVAERAVRSGITLVAAGGNNGADACDYSPASVSAAITVGAIDSEDNIAPFSNTGRCISVYAPGVEVPSAYLHNTSKRLSGTSMAAPHVSGIAALYLGERHYRPEELKILIESDAATVGHIRIASTRILNLRLA